MATSLRLPLLLSLLGWLAGIIAVLWARGHSPVGDLILPAGPRWSMQVWLGPESIISQQPAPATTPMVLLFYSTPPTGTHLLVRATLPAWPLELSAGVVIMFGLLLLAGGMLS